jgi:peptidoglycan hydrolase-like protein with peptidoglycan-binding domain
MGYVSADYLPFEAWACLVDLPNDFVQVEKPTHNFARDMRYGWKGQEVVALQNCLKYLGVFPQIIESTGYFGKITEQAVKTFEMSYNLPITGEVKGDTRMKLNNIFA